MVVLIPCYPVDTKLLVQTVQFQGLENKEMELICRDGKCCYIPTGGFIFYQGDPAQRIYAILKGWLKLVQNNPEGEQVIIRLIGPTTFFGVVALTQNSEYLLSAQATEESTVIYWTRDEFLMWIRKVPTLALNAFHMMADHAHELQDRFTQLATERVERRLARTLLRLARQTGRKVPNGVLIDMPLTRKDLAEMIGASLFTVSRLLKKWEDQGIVTSKRKSITIRYPHGLVCIAEDTSNPSFVP